MDKGNHAEGGEMNLENLCVSLETAKKLQEAGIVIGSVYGWVVYKSGEIKLVEADKHHSFQDQVSAYYPAPTAEELFAYCYSCDYITLEILMMSIYKDILFIGGKISLKEVLAKIALRIKKG
jgi:hypothetical protein